MRGLTRVLIIDSDPGNADGISASVVRLGWMPLFGRDGDADVSVVDAGVLADDRTVLSDLRRVRPGIPILLTLDAETLDLAAMALGLDGLAFLPRSPAAHELALALAVVRSADPAAIAAESDSGYGLRLAALGEEIARIARAIEPPVALADAPPVPSAPLAFDPAIVRDVLKARRQRDALFAPGTFADPAWDMLLDLTAARGEGKRVAVSSLAIAASVPPTTALRHLKAMIEAGLVARHADPEDGRRAFIDLSDDAFARMRAWVAALPKPV